MQKVDYLVLSHGHSDHTGGLRYFMELNTKATVACKREVFLPKFKDERENGIKHDGVRKYAPSLPRVIKTADGPIA